MLCEIQDVPGESGLEGSVRWDSTVVLAPGGTWARIATVGDITLTSNFLFVTKGLCRILTCSGNFRMPQKGHQPCPHLQ